MSGTEQTTGWIRRKARHRVLICFLSRSNPDLRTWTWTVQLRIVLGPVKRFLLSQVGEHLAANPLYVVVIHGFAVTCDYKINLTACVMFCAIEHNTTNITRLPVVYSWFVVRNEMTKRVFAKHRQLLNGKEIFQNGVVRKAKQVLLGPKDKRWLCELVTRFLWIKSQEAVVSVLFWICRPYSVWLKHACLEFCLKTFLLAHIFSLQVVMLFYPEILMISDA